MAKSKKKPKKPKSRIKVAPPSKRHKSVKDYDRKVSKKVTVDNQEECFDKISDAVSSGARVVEGSVLKAIESADFADFDKIERQWKMDVIESEEPEKSWIDYFFAIFGFKRK